MNSKITSTFILLIIFVLSFTGSVFCDQKILLAQENEKINIYSPTNYNENEWYSNQNIILNWETSEEITGTSWELDNTPLTKPDTTSEGILYSKTYENISSGIWYFHLRIKDKDGNWTEPSHFKIQIDREEPEDFDIIVDNQGDSTLPSPALYFESQDKLSGVNHYEIELDNQKIITVDLNNINPYFTPALTPDIHNVSVIAVDNTGNKKKVSTEIQIDSIPTPEILIYSETYTAGEELLYIGGKSLPNSNITIYLTIHEKLVKIWKTNSDHEGSWSFYTDELFSSGDYTVSATTEDSRGAISDYSNSHEIEIFLNGLKIGSHLIDFGSLAYTLLALTIILLIFLIFYCHKIRKERGVIAKETTEAEIALKQSFKELRKNLGEKIEYLDSKPGLSPKEKRIKKEIFSILKKSEKIIEKEIMDIENEIK